MRLLFFVFAILFLVFNKADFLPENSFNKDYLKKSNTTAINGIFVILVIISHFSQYASLEGAYDDSYLALKGHLNQMVVATFLFYSGYGMLESIKRKGLSYVRSVPLKFFNLLLRFDCAVILYLLLSLCIGTHYPVKHTLLAFTSWTAIGNSNWYITAILIIYILFYISFNFGFKIIGGQGGEKLGIVLLFLLTALCVLFQMRIGRPGYCYNTMMLFPLGCLYSEYKKRIERRVMKNDITYMLSVALTLVIYIITYTHRWEWGLLCFTVWSFAFIFLVLLLTMKLRIQNAALECFGSHVFSIYILQRIPMIILDHFGCIESHKYISLVLVFVTTIPMALIFEKLTDNIWYVITKRIHARS